MTDPAPADSAPTSELPDLSGLRRFSRLSMVYDADGGLRGEARYIVGHLLGRVSCDLCDITHGPVRRKSDFDALLAAVGIPVDVVHRNEQSPELAAFTAGRLACVVGHGAEGLEMVVPRARLAACEGSVACLARELADAGQPGEEQGRG